MWKPANPPASGQPNSTPVASTPTQTKPNASPVAETPRPTHAAEPTPAPANRNAVLNTQEQATIGASLSRVKLPVPSRCISTVKSKAPSNCRAIA